MDVWLMHHWKALSGGWMLPVAIWLYRKLSFRHLSLEGDTWTFEYRKPEARPLREEARKSKSRR
jgi:hypothetical protein